MLEVTGPAAFNWPWARGSPSCDGVIRVGDRVSA